VYEIDGHIAIHLAEVVEAGAPSRIVVRWITMPMSMRAISNPTPTATGTKYTSRIGLQVANGTAEKVEPDIQKAMAESNIRLKAIVEAGTRFSAPGE